MSDDLVEWLRAQLDADERDGSTSHAFGCTVYDPVYEDPLREAPLTDANACSCKARRVLREVEAKRRILALHAVRDGTGGHWDTDPAALCNECSDLYPCDTVRLLAAIFDDRPGYRENWRPA